MRINMTVLVLFVCLGLGKAATSEAFGYPVYDDAAGLFGTVFEFPETVVPAPLL